MTQPSAFETRHRYTIHGKIASGGMGTIRLGLQLVTEGFSRVVAVKQIHSMYANNQEFVAMFREEFRVASRVVHPNVVPILDVMTADEELSLVMEYVHGLSVARLIPSTREAPSPEIATTIVIGMLHGLHAAHEALSEKGEHLNVVHRDVTPHNVMVGIDGTPRLLDFGIAHALGRSRTTMVGQIKGKARYLAPEQLEGQPIDRRADIYAASVVFWEMLTGRRLFRSDKDDGSIDVVARHAVESPHLIQPGVSPHLSAIVLRGLQPDPEARYPTALEMAVALEESAATVSATKVGEWVRRTWGGAELVRRQQIRAIEGSARGASEPEDRRPRGRDQERLSVNGEIAIAADSSESQLTVPGRRLPRFARESKAEPTISWGPDDSLFGPRRELPPLTGRRRRKPDRRREETPPTESPWPVTGQVSPARRKGRVATLAAVLVVLPSALVLALFVTRGAWLPTARAPVAASPDRPAELSPARPVPIRSFPVIEMTTPPLPSGAPPEGEGAPPSDAPPPGPPEAQPAPAPAASVPASNQRVAQAPRRRSASAVRAEPSGGSKIARSRKAPRKSARTASASSVGKAVDTSIENASAPPPPVVAPPSCDPPFVIDDDGIKHFKLSCL